MEFLPRLFRSGWRSSLWVILLPLGLASCATHPQQLRLATGSTTGYYYRLGQTLETSIEETVNLDIEVQTSKGSTENLQQLLAGQIDLAIVQLDVAKQQMKSGEVKAIAVLAEEHIHLLSHSRDSQSAPKSLTDLAGQSIALGAQGSGTRFTASAILEAAHLEPSSGKIQVDESNFSEALTRLSQNQIDATFYVGRLGANDRLREAAVQDPGLTLLPLPTNLINFLVAQSPGTYRAANIPKGIYRFQPSLPERELTTLTTPTVLITRPDAHPSAIRLITWSILDKARRYASFYPELQFGEPKTLLRRGLFYIHPAATEVYDKGDPRKAWVRYLENNSDLQAGIFLLVGTSGLGMLLQRWRRQRSQHLVDSTNSRIAEISVTLNEDPQEALREIDALSQDNRLQFIAGNVPDEVYQQVQQRTQSFSEQCRSVIETQRREQILETLLLLDDWQETLQANPEAALQKLSQIKQQYREMLLSNQVDIQAYMELVELTLISVMTLAPKQREPVEAIPASVLVRAD